MIQRMLKEKNMSIYRLSKLSGVPYTTLNDLANGKTSPGNCSAENVYKIAKVLGVTVEDLLAPYLEKRGDFENFKSTICHQLRNLGDFAFILDTLQKKMIWEYYRREWYPECFYMLAMLDYLSRENGVPLCSDYDALRKCKLEQPLFPSGIRARVSAEGNYQAMKEALENAIPEFLNFNLVESEIRDVV